MLTFIYYRLVYTNIKIINAKTYVVLYIIVVFIFSPTRLLLLNITENLDRL